MEFQIKTSWDDSKLNLDPYTIRIHPFNSEKKILRVDWSGPYFGDPIVADEWPGRIPELWNYEVIELFFLNDRQQYLEIECDPHGHFLVLILNGVRKIIKDDFLLRTECLIENGIWKGYVEIPEDYFPQNTCKFNAYAIHGSEPNRIYCSLYPVPNGKYEKPDFHRLDYFQEINFMQVGLDTTTQQSEIWTNIK